MENQAVKVINEDIEDLVRALNGIKTQEVRAARDFLERRNFLPFYDELTSAGFSVEPTGNNSIRVTHKHEYPYCGVYITADGRMFYGDNRRPSFFAVKKIEEITGLKLDEEETIK
jgi:hypothetical protein